MTTAPAHNGRRRRTGVWRTAAVGLTLAAVVALTGCGGSEGAGTAGTSQTDATSAAVSVGADGVSLVEQVALLRVEAERRAGYDRDLFEHWVDDDRDGCDTRGEILETESSVPVTRCKGTGLWVSLYDGYSTDDPTELEIDHVVALAEAWDSGAWAWDPARRRAFANDLSDPAALRAVTSASNQSKSDKDPAEWQPSARDAWCQYVTDWVHVKLVWGLSADAREVEALKNMAQGCVPLVPGAVSTTGVPTPTALTAPAGVPGDTGPAGAVLYGSCAEARAAGATPLRRGEAGYRPEMDGDGDGLACE